MTGAQGWQVLRPREVPLGEPGSMTVRRTLPHRVRPFVGAWCFVDHYGPMRLEPGSPGMDVPPHPHTGLQTVSWLFEGEIEHRDSGGVHAIVRPGEVNLMTGGHGIAHSEVSTPATRVLHGVQLWVALPNHARDADRDFTHLSVPLQQLPDSDGCQARVFVGELAGVASSAVPTYTALLGAELTMPPGSRLTLNVHQEFEHALLVDTGSVTLVDGGRTEVGALAPGELGYLPAGRSSVQIRAGNEPVRLVLLGGEPFHEQIVMWWNFVARSHQEVAAWRAEWQAGSDRFGEVAGYQGEISRLPAPELPRARLRPRGNPPAADR